MSAREVAATDASPPYRLQIWMPDASLWANVVGTFDQQDEAVLEGEKRASRTADVRVVDGDLTSVARWTCGQRTFP